MTPLILNLGSRWTWMVCFTPRSVYPGGGRAETDLGTQWIGDLNRKIIIIIIIKENQFWRCEFKKFVPQIWMFLSVCDGQTGSRRAWSNLIMSSAEIEADGTTPLIAACCHLSPCFCLTMCLNCCGARRWFACTHHANSTSAASQFVVLRIVIDWSNYTFLGLLTNYENFSNSEVSGYFERGTYVTHTVSKCPLTFGFGDANKFSFRKPVFSFKYGVMNIAQKLGNLKC